MDSSFSKTIDFDLFSTKGFKQASLLKSVLSTSEQGELLLDDLQDHLEEILNNANRKYQQFILSKLDVILQAGTELYTMENNAKNLQSLLDVSHAKLQQDIFSQQELTHFSAKLTSDHFYISKNFEAKGLLIDMLHDFDASFHRMAYKDALDILDEIARHVQHCSPEIFTSHLHFSKNLDKYIIEKKKLIEQNILSEIRSASQKRFSELATIARHLGVQSLFLESFLNFREEILNSLFP